MSEENKSDLDKLIESKDEYNMFKVPDDAVILPEGTVTLCITRPDGKTEHIDGYSYGDKGISAKPKPDKKVKKNVSLKK
jgi:hypothetical protein